MHGLLERIEGEEPEGGLYRGVHLPGLALLREEPGQDLERQLPQPLALGQEPFLEGRGVHGKAREQVAAVERRRLGKRCGRRLGGQALELRDIDVHSTRVERDDGFGRAQRGRRARQSAAQQDQHAAEVLPCQAVGHLGPE